MKNRIKSTPNERNLTQDMPILLETQAKMQWTGKTCNKTSRRGVKTRIKLKHCKKINTDVQKHKTNSL